jgi:23S rRNA pseudouridine2605 synthase
LELWLEFTLSQGINRQIRRMCRDTGLTILTLRRVQQGSLRLGDLPKGKVRELTEEEIRLLRRQAGLEEMV